MSSVNLVFVFCAAIVCDIICAVKTVKNREKSHFYFPLFCLFILGCIELGTLPAWGFSGICPWMVIATIILCAAMVFKKKSKALYPGMVGVLLFCTGDILACRLEEILAFFSIGSRGLSDGLLYAGIIIMLLGFLIATFADEVINTLPKMIHMAKGRHKSNDA